MVGQLKGGYLITMSRKETWWWWWWTWTRTYSPQQQALVKKKERWWRNPIFWQSVSQLPCTQRYVCEHICELLGSIIPSACLVWGL